MGFSFGPGFEPPQLHLRPPKLQRRKASPSYAEASSGFGGRGPLSELTFEGELTYP